MLMYSIKILTGFLFVLSTLSEAYTWTQPGKNGYIGKNCQGDSKKACKVENNLNEDIVSLTSRKGTLLPHKPSRRQKSHIVMHGDYILHFEPDYNINRKPFTINSYEATESGYDKDGKPGSPIDTFKVTPIGPDYRPKSIFDIDNDDEDGYKNVPKNTNNDIENNPANDSKNKNKPDPSKDANDSNYNKYTPESNKPQLEEATPYFLFFGR